MRREAVTLAIGSGLVVRGQRWGDGENWAILVHDVGEDLDAWLDLPPLLADQGYAVLAFDLPGHGLSDDPWEPRHLRQALDRALTHARSAGARRLFVIAAGTSAGPGLAVAGDGGIDALVLLSPQVEAHGYDVARGADQPKLLLVGAVDNEGLSEAQHLFRRCRGWTVLSALPVAEQGTALLRSSWQTQAWEQVRLFLRDYRR